MNWNNFPRFLQMPTIAAEHNGNEFGETSGLGFSSQDLEKQAFRRLLSETEVI